MIPKRRNPINRNAAGASWPRKQIAVERPGRDGYDRYQAYEEAESAADHSAMLMLGPDTRLCGTALAASGVDQQESLK